MAVYVGQLEDFRIETLTDAGETVFRVTHLASGAVDTLHGMELIEVGGEIFDLASTATDNPILLGAAQLQDMGVPAWWLG